MNGASRDSRRDSAAMNADDLRPYPAHPSSVGELNRKFGQAHRGHELSLRGLQDLHEQATGDRQQIGYLGIGEPVEDQAPPPLGRDETGADALDAFLGGGVSAPAPATGLSNAAQGLYRSSDMHVAMPAQGRGGAPDPFEDDIFSVLEQDFGAIAPGDGHTHNCYVGAIGKLTVIASYFHHGATGHLLKTRAAVNHVLYNRLTDETGRASFELEFPNGGLALVMGNVIQQSAATENYHLIAYGNEGLSNRRNELHLINNTLVDRRPQGGVYLRMAQPAQKLRLINNLLHGKHELPGGPDREQHHNYFVELDSFVDPDRYDFRLRTGSPLFGRAVDAGVVDGQPLRPAMQYQHPCALKEIPAGTAYTPGAFQV